MLIGFLLALLAVTVAASLFGLFRLMFAKGKRKSGLKIIGLSVAAFIAGIVVVAVFFETPEMTAAREEGWSSIYEKDRAAEAGYSTPKEWAAHKEALEADRAASAAAAAEARRREKVEREAAKQAEEEARLAAEAEKERLEQERLEAEKAEEKRKGFHCLSPWDGSHDDFKRLVKASMREPKSFEHIETRITPVDEDGNHQLRMTYRARNGFGGMNVSEAYALVDNETCTAVPLQIE